MKLIGKIIAAPFVVALSILVAVLSFLFEYASIVLKIAVGFCAVVGAVYLFSGTIVNGCIVLFIGFLLSPYGLPAIGEWIIGLLDGINYSLKCFITS